MIKYIVLLISCLIFNYSIAQENKGLSERPYELGVEYQMYPTGYIPSIKFEFGIGKYLKHGLNLSLGYNIARRKGWGQHEDERGGGYGGGIGYRYYINRVFEGLYMGAKVAVWDTKIDWRNSGTDEILWTNDDVFSSTDILILQPTLEIGYKFRLREKFILSPQLSLGWEYNAKTIGDPVGQGAIFLWGGDIAYRFGSKKKEDTNPINL